jgi:lysophospholipase L1-like esterase
LSPAANASRLNPWLRRLIGIAAWLVAFHTLLAYGLPAGVFAAIVLLLGALFYRVGALGAVTTAAALLTVTLVYALAIKLTGLEDALYYRPHERLASYDYEHNHRAYRRNAELAMRMPHGDLQSMTRADIAQARDVVFRTDSDGFRNDADYRGQRYVLVGDSFIAAVGDSQEDMLNAQLARDHGIETYNLGHPGDLGDYLAYIEGFRRRHGEDFKVLLFLFEGNDFPDALPPPRHQRYPAFALFWKRYYNLFSDTGVFRLTRSLIKRATRFGSIARSEDVAIHPVGDVPMGFYQPYIEASRRAEYRPGPEVAAALATLAPQLEHVFFVPTKYRVYHKQIAPAEHLPNAHWGWLADICRSHGLRCTDLTPALTAAAERLLPQGRFTWWRDDTHWNAEGMAVAARAVAAALEQRAR